MSGQEERVRLVSDWLRNGYDDTDDADVQASNLVALLGAADDDPAAVIDAAFLSRKREWSRATFGPQSPLGVLDHIRKELPEIEADPTDVGEWVDVVNLALDGAWRAGGEPQQIIDAIHAKQTRNEARTWPDWRTLGKDQAIEHVREDAALAAADDDLAERIAQAIEAPGAHHDTWCATSLCVPDDCLCQAREAARIARSFKAAP